MTEQQKHFIKTLTGYSYEEILAMSNQDFYLFKIGPLTNSSLDFKQINYLIKQRHELKKTN